MLEAVKLSCILNPVSAHNTHKEHITIPKKVSRFLTCDKVGLGYS